jgi:hypothetical protein
MSLKVILVFNTVGIKKYSAMKLNIGILLESDQK